jgi:hypothetical protein
MIPRGRRQMKAAMIALAMAKAVQANSTLSN